jgi:nitrilase
MPSIIAAVAQVGSILFDTAAALEKVDSYCREAAARGAKIVVFPEALLGGYPKGITFGVTVGSRSDEGREWYRRYWDAAIDIPGVKTARCQKLADELGLVIVIGVIERLGRTLHCTALTFQPGAEMPEIHRKLMPTAAERLIWGFGDGSTMRVIETPVGRVGCAICWENYMPAYRLHLYGQNIELYCAPTVDDREMFRTTMRHIAYEGRCFVLCACQYFTPAMCPPDYPATPLIAGGSFIVSPMGEVLTPPADGECLLTAEIDLAEITKGKFDLDVVGHYARADVFALRVNTPSA